MDEPKTDQVLTHIEMEDIYKEELRNLFPESPTLADQAEIKTVFFNIFVGAEARDFLSDIFEEYFPFQPIEKLFAVRMRIARIIVRSILIERKACQKVAIDWAKKAMDASSKQSAVYCSQIVTDIGKRP